jgi:hypothetical protein
METIRLDREEIIVTGKFTTCYDKYAATTAAINDILPTHLFITEQVWLHEGKVDIKLYSTVEKREGFTPEEYQALTGFSSRQEVGYAVQPINGLMHVLPENGNWSVIGGADVFNSKYAKLITVVKVDAGKIIIPAI